MSGMSEHPVPAVTEDVHEVRLIKVFGAEDLDCVTTAAPGGEKEN